ncbi:HHR087Cp [Eremothecium sinecaudum]|uniref:HHR087Cp n=1 Tax=Eremothecium sinecaudum TaxID=45286 RepID=A0A0X8HW82_9SACH|nr:HHR087Cp [Eremothecium sinecaudum]AMD22856.1 HHR087Cp [Eremothecium sinecaudum]
MTDTLYEHIFVQLKQLLPIESSMSTYAEIENEPFYVNARLALFNLGIVEGLETMIRHFLKLMDKIILKQGSGTERFNEDELNSLLVLLRLLNDIIEVCWQEYEYQQTSSESEKKRALKNHEKLYLQFSVGFATQRDYSHTISPPPMDPGIADTLIKVISNCKSSSHSQNLLRQIAGSLYRTGELAGRASVIEKESKGQNMTEYAKLLGNLDICNEALMRFIAAANSDQFYRYVEENIVAHSLQELPNSNSLVQYLDLFSYFFITDKNLPKFLELTSRMVAHFKNPVHREFLLTFVSQSIKMWLLSRPKEYLRVANDIVKNPNDPTVRRIVKESSYLFEEVYASFNVASILTEAPSTHPNSSSPTTSGTSTSLHSSMHDPLSSSRVVNGSLYSSTNTHTATKISSEDGLHSSSALASSDVATTYTSISKDVDDTENLTNLSVLRFLSCILMLHPQTFDEINSIRFKNIPDIITGDEISATSGQESDKDRVTSSQQFGDRPARPMSSLPLVANGSSRTKFLMTLIRILNGSQVVSDKALLDTLRTLILISRLSAAMFAYDKYTPPIYFSRRIFLVMCDSLQLCKEAPGRKHVLIAKCLSRHPVAHTKLQVDYFPVACSLEPVVFHQKIEEFLMEKREGLEHLRMVTEGLKIFFTLSQYETPKDQVVERAFVLLQRTAHEMSDILLRYSAVLDDRVNGIIDDLFEGLLVEDDSLDNVPSSDPDPTIPGFMDPFIPIESPKLSSHASSVPSSHSMATDKSDQPHYFSSPQLRPQMESPHAMRSHHSSSIMKRATGSPVDERLQRIVRPSSTATSTKSPFGFTYASEANSQASFQQSSTAAPLSSGHLSNENPEESILQTAREIMVNIYTSYEDTLHFYMRNPSSRNVSPIPVENLNAFVKPVFVGLIEEGTETHKAVLAYSDVGVSYFKHFKNDLTLEYALSICKSSGYLIILLAAVLFNLTLSEERREHLLTLLTRFWEFRLEVIKHFDSINHLHELNEAESVLFLLIRGSCGRALFISLCSHEPRIHKLLKNGFKLYCKEVEYRSKITGESDYLQKDNKSFLTAICRDSYVATGALAFQRRLRSDILCHIKYPDRILYDSLKLIYNRWYEMSKATGLTQTELNHYRNYAGIIAASSGVFLTIDTETLNNLSYLANVRHRIAANIDYFIKKQCQSLDNEDLLTRENSKDIISTELHPLVFPTLFHHLKAKVRELEAIDVIAPENELSFILLEQIILILRVIMERDDEIDILVQISLDLLDLIEGIFKIVEQIKHDSPKYFKCIIQLSKMLRSCEHSEERLCLSGFMLIKNRWIRTAMQWFESTIFKEYDLDNLGKPHRNMDLQRRDLDYLYIDTSIESSKVLAYLTKNLVLEAPPSLSETELIRSKQVVFGNFFNILLKGLEKSTSIKKFPPTLRHKIGLLNDNITTSLTNLLNFNVDVGFKYALPIGYSPNRNIKVAFLKVFVNIVTNFDISNKEITQKRNAAIEELAMAAVKDPSLVSKTARVCPANDTDALAGSLVSIFNIKNAAHLIVIELIRDEISTASRYMDILRRNSCATRALSMYSRLKGGAYLAAVLKPVIDGVISTGETFDVEKISPDDPDCERNVALLSKYLTILVDSIVGSIDKVPPEFFVICQAIYRYVNEKFPDVAEIAVGSFIFLRFFCPALVSPDSEGLIGTFYAKERRSFIVLAKVIQNIANGSVSSLKWPALQSKADFLKESGDRIFKFLKELSNSDRQVTITTAPENKVTVDDFHLLHKFLYHHALDVRKEIINSNIKSSEDLERLKMSGKLIDNLLGLLGQPRMEFKNAIPPYIRENMESNPELYDFMSRHSLKTLDDVDIPFVHTSVTSDGLPALVFSWVLAAKYLQIDIEMVLYRMFQIYAKIWTTRHYVVVDCTSFESKHLDEMAVKKVIAMCYKLLPNELSKNCVGFYHYNLTKRYLDIWLPIIKANLNLVTLDVPCYFLNSNSPLKTIKMLGLSDYSADLYSDVRVTLHDASLYDETHQRFEPITLKVSNKHFQVVYKTPKSVKVTKNGGISEIYFNNVFEISEIKSAGISNDRGVPYEFFIQMEDGQNLTFSSPKYLEVLKILHYSQARLEEESKDELPGAILSSQDHDKKKDITYIIGHILMIIFVGLNSEDEAVEAVGYNLLAATQSTFGLNFGHKLTISPEVYVPGDSSAFYNSILNGLAITAPELAECIWLNSMDLLENVLNDKQIPRLLVALSPWTKNLYENVYMVDDEEGHDLTVHIIRRLIRITAKQELHSLLYAQFIWTNLILEGNLTELIFEQVIYHCVDRESEGSDWRKIVFILTRIPTPDVCGLVLTRIHNISNSFLPTLKMEASTHSWSELIILVEIAVSLLFDSLLLAQIFLPDILCAVSLLIDVGPTELRSALHRLLMNVCQSFSNNELLPDANRKNLEIVSNVFARQKLKFMFGFSQDKGRVLQNFSASSFLTKFTTLECFIDNIILLMDNASVNDSLYWKTKYIIYIIGVVTNVESFLSSRAMMIMGIVARSGIDDQICRKLLTQTMKVMAVPCITEELLFYAISHVFAYSRIVDGLKPSSELLPQLFWLSTTYMRSPNTMIYQGGLLLMVNSCQRLKLGNTEDNRPKSIFAYLYSRREFFKPVLDELESLLKLHFNDRNFAHVLITFISKGLLVPFVRGIAIDALTKFFKLTYAEFQESGSNEYLVFLLFLYIVQRPDHFEKLKNEVGIDSTVVLLDDDATKIPQVLLTWLESGECSAEITLYQTAVYFASRSSDEPSKARFLLLLKHLATNRSPVVFKVLGVMKEELKRINTFDVANNVVNISFVVIRLLVIQREFISFNEISAQMEAYLASRDLIGISDIESDLTSNDLITLNKYQREVFYERRKQVLTIVSKIIESEQ